VRTLPGSAAPEMDGGVRFKGMGGGGGVSSAALWSAALAATSAQSKTSRIATRVRHFGKSGPVSSRRIAYARRRKRLALTLHPCTAVGHRPRPSTPKGIVESTPVALTASRTHFAIGCQQGVSGSHGYSTQCRTPVWAETGAFAVKSCNSRHSTDMRRCDHNLRVGGSSPSSGTRYRDTSMKSRAARRDG